MASNGSVRHRHWPGDTAGYHSVSDEFEAGGVLLEQGCVLRSQSGVIPEPPDAFSGVTPAENHCRAGLLNRTVPDDREHDHHLDGSDRLAVSDGLTAGHQLGPSVPGQGLVPSGGDGLYVRGCLPLRQRHLGQHPSEISGFLPSWVTSAIDQRTAASLSCTGAIYSPRPSRVETPLASDSSYVLK
jgi:hypothetical protein